jgi:hypothetical protein
MAKKSGGYVPQKPRIKSTEAPSADVTFQDQLADLEDPFGVAGTNMTAQEAADLVEAGEGDTLAEHGPEEPPVEPPPPPPEDAKKAFSPHRPAGKDHDPFRD